MLAPSPSRRGPGERTLPGRFLALALLALATVLPGCGDDPQAPAPRDFADAQTLRGVYDAAAGTLEFQLESPDGTVSPFRLVASNIHQDPDSQLVHAWVAIRNTSGAALPGPDGIWVSDFVPEEVSPVNAPCAVGPAFPCPIVGGCPGGVACVFDHRGTYGEDGALAPAETSEPVEWIIHNPSGESFAFSASVVPGAQQPGPGQISGVVFRDLNADGHLQDDEPGIAGAVLSLESGDLVQVTQTDAVGRYAFQVEEPGLYELSWQPSDCRPTTPTQLQVLILLRPDSTLSGFSRGDFGCSAGVNAGIEVSGMVFLDHNRNGVPDPGESGLPGVLLTGSTPNCPTFAVIEARTDERGRYRMQLPFCAPPFIVQREAIPGTIDTSPNPVVFERVPSGVVLLANFGVAPVDSTQKFLVEGVVFLDENKNGARDAGESGVAGVVMEVRGAFCRAVPETTLTDANGNYRLQHICELPWVVTRHGEWLDTTPNPVFLSTPPADGSNTFHVDFGVAPVDSTQTELFIEGTVYLDENRNGSRDAGEGGVAGVDITASGLLCLTPVSAYTRTDASGSYRLRGADVHCLLPWSVGRHGNWIDTTPNPVFLYGPPDAGDTFHVDFGVAPPDSTPPPGAFAVEGFVFADWDRDGVRERGEPGIPNVEVLLVSRCTLFRAVRTDLNGHYRFEPEVVKHCPVEAVWQSQPLFREHTTPNPAPLDPAIGGPSVVVHFGVIPERVQP